MEVFSFHVTLVSIPYNDNLKSSVVREVEGGVLVNLSTRLSKSKVCCCVRLRMF